MPRFWMHKVPVEHTGPPIPDRLITSALVEVPAEVIDVPDETNNTQSVKPIEACVNLQTNYFNLADMSCR